MKPYHILRSFPGNQIGCGPTEQFEAGTVRDLSASLAAVVLKEGWVEPFAAGGVVVEAEPVLVGEKANALTLEEFRRDLPEVRETKVTGPEETKVVGPEETKKTEAKPAKKKR